MMPVARSAFGFTLLEMLLVVALLAATAGMSLVVMGGRDQQVRRDETVRRLDDIVRAVAGSPAALWGGEVRLSGFVADNGRLPQSLHELTAADALLDADECKGVSAATAATLLNCHRVRAPVFDPSPDSATGRHDGSGDEISLSQPAEALPKGLRRYLEGASGGTVFRDGWGSQSISGDDASNHGWVLTLPAAEGEDWSVGSLGSNNAVDATAPTPDDALVADITRRVRPQDWSVDVTGWSIRLTNASGISLPSSGGYLGVSLLVWENLYGGGRWRRLTTALDNSVLAPGDHRDFAFPSGGYPGGAQSSRVPAGEHLLVVVSSPDAAAHDGDDEPLVINGYRVTTQVRMYAGAARPTVEMVLR